MIIVKGSIPVKTDHREEAVALVESLAERSRSESGCLSYEVYVKADAPQVIVIWQQWTSMDALEAHFCSEHVDCFLDAIPDYIDGQVTSEHYDVGVGSHADTESSVPERHHLEFAEGTRIH